MKTEFDFYPVDPWLRIEKAAWTQLTSAVRRALDSALESCPVTTPRVNFVCREAELVREVTFGTAVHGVHVDPGCISLPGRATVVVHPPSRAPHALIQAVQHAMRLTRGGGSIILATSVVDGPSTPALSLTEVFECLQHASGMALHLDDLRSIRWANERLHRGALISATLLAQDTGRIDDA